MITISDLTHQMGGRSLFEAMSLRMARGEHSLLLGPSGSGKSTLINLICGLLTPDCGSILIAGDPMTGIGPSRRDALRRRRIGLVFQSLRLVSALDVRQNLLLAQRLAGAPHSVAAVDTLIEAAGISHRAYARPRDLSQGEAQRAAIARALVGTPDLLVADEPTSALDDASMARIARLMIERADASGATLLVATHDARLRPLFGRVVTL
ncbi:ATP-binding cassette domain-containing protein [Sphingomonas sp. BGYR3]|uniref:ABC transporter ATP-binding protein n=1 Tax=Sphingomonas sp. BGYR3 TaxID=2975483 RepID=UPI0021A8987C|nr:ATP-binding cassette domain-containing protein [Sphingomonas sp. BGYR3]